MTEEKQPVREEEKIQRTDWTKGEFSPSGIESARCFRRFFYTKMLGLKPKTTPVALNYGIAIHKAVEVYYSARERGLSDFDTKAAALQAFTKSWVSRGGVGDKKRNLEGGIVTINNYCDKYARDSLNFKRENIESDQWMPMPNGTMILVKIDRVHNESGNIFIIDTKTTSSGITDYYFSQYENHLPTSLYYHVVQSLLGRCDGVQIDAIKVPPPSATSTSEAFRRSMFIRTDLQIHDAIQTFCSMTDYIVSVGQKPKSQWADRMFCNQGECDKWGGCPFLAVCKHGFSHPSVRVDFDVEEVSDPELGKML